MNMPLLLLVALIGATVGDHLDRKRGEKRWETETEVSGFDTVGAPHMALRRRHHRRSAAHGSPAAWVLLQSRRRWWFGVISLVAARVPLTIRRRR
ncbi:hypothetical protein HanRHA438_Chr03g0136371 [Helianthus annuus]|nr:hypothetical protein HanRHA438_Chr03g0136371 [Helianthus annuus]